MPEFTLAIDNNSNNNKKRHSMPTPAQTWAAPLSLCAVIYSCPSPRRSSSCFFSLPPPDPPLAVSLAQHPDLSRVSYTSFHSFKQHATDKATAGRFPPFSLPKSRNTNLKVFLRFCLRTRCCRNETQPSAPYGWRWTRRLHQARLNAGNIPVLIALQRSNNLTAGGQIAVPAHQNHLSFAPPLSSTIPKQPDSSRALCLTRIKQ